MQSVCVTVRTFNFKSHNVILILKGLATTKKKNEQVWRFRDIDS